jgi:DNA polymerase-1
MIELSFPLKGRNRPVHVPENEDDLRKFRDWLRHWGHRVPIGFDTETTGLNIFQNSFRLRTMQFGTRNEAWVLRVEDWSAALAVGEWALCFADRLRIHNAPYDWLVCDEHVPNITMEYLRTKTADTMVKAKVLDPRSRKEGGIGAKLKELCELFVDASAPDTQDGLMHVFHRYGRTKDTGWDLPQLMTDPTYLAYAGGDVILVSELDPILDEKLAALGVRAELIDYEHELARICASMTRAGLLIDVPYTEQLDRKLEADFDKWTGVAADHGIKSVNSGPQVAEALIKSGVELTAKTDGGEWSTDKTVLNPLAGYSVKGERLDHITPHPIAEAVYHAKRAGKWRTTYVERFLNNRDDNGLIHPSINTLQARTARMSITGDLAAQTLPSSDWLIRRAIVGAEDEVAFSVDFKAVEMRVLASLADVKRMKQAIAEDRDLHDFTTELVYGADFTKTQRKICKGIGFGKVYGGGLETLTLLSGAPRADVKVALARYDAVYPEIGRAGRRWQREARRNGFVTVTATGRPLPIDPDRAYTVTNYKCQSTARDVLGQGLIMIDEAGLLPYLRLPIHDEVVGFAKRSEADEIVREVERCMTMSLGGVPIDAEGEFKGRSWGSLYGAEV